MIVNNILQRRTAQIKNTKRYLLAGPAILLIVGLVVYDKQQPAETEEKSKDQANAATGQTMAEKPVSRQTGVMAGEAMQYAVVDQASVQVGEAGGAIDETTRMLAEQDENAVTILDDAAITAWVETNIMEELGFEGMQSNDDTVQGITTVTGSSGLPKISARAEELAGTDEGVNRVENQLAVTSSE